jgi:hypothetical protein
MKKGVHLLVCLALCCMTANAANVYLYDFESTETSPVKITNSGWLYPESLNIIDNPLQDGINTSGKCFTFEAQNGIEWWGGPVLSLKSTVTTETVRYLYVQILAEDVFSSNFQIGLFNDNADGTYADVGVNLKPVASANFNTKWKEFCFEIDPGVTFSAIRLQPWIWGVFYIDNIRLSDEAPIIPEIKPFSINFENADQSSDWSTYSNAGQVYKTTTNEDPFTQSTTVNTSDSCLRVWITNGMWSDYGGAKYNNIYGVTTEQSRYLHVKYFFLSNEDHPDQYNLPLRVFTDANDSPFESQSLIRKEWHDVTIDLGLGTLVKFLNFNINDWWVTVGLDDIQLDGSPEREILATHNPTGSSISFIPEKNSVLVNGINGMTAITVFNLTGSVVKSVEINATTSISLPKGFFIIKAINANESISTKILIK